MKSLKNRSASVPNSRWLAYATAGIASACACTPFAEGAIHYSGPINKVVNRLDRFVFSLDQHHDFIRLSVATGTAYAGYPHFGVGGLAGAAIVGFLTNNGWPEASNVKWGQLISSEPFIQAHTASFNAYGGFVRDRATGYLGFKFNNGSGDQYGWVRIKTTKAFGSRFTLLDYAYGDVGDRIAAGQKRDEPNNLELESLGGLA
jgi:hypothetical protein